MKKILLGLAGFCFLTILSLGFSTIGEAKILHPWDSTYEEISATVELSPFKKIREGQDSFINVTDSEELDIGIVYTFENHQLVEIVLMFNTEKQFQVAVEMIYNKFGTPTTIYKGGYKRWKLDDTIVTASTEHKLVAYKKY